MRPEINPALVSGFKSPDRVMGHVPTSLLLAYSGGADSSFLLHVLAEWCRQRGTRLCAAHVNHSIRGDEALRDRDFCVESANKLGVECFVLDADVPALAKEKKQGLEVTAREVRYEFFREIMEKEGIEALVTAHNADDNLETLIFRLTRGSGAKGLCGIPEKRDLGKGKFAIRPILSIKKEEILDMCRHFDIKYVCDSTNADQIYSRNRIRLNVIPQLREINPAIHASAARASALLSDDCDFIDGEAKKYLATPDFNKIGNLQALHGALLRRVLAKMIAEVTDAMIEYVHMEALSSLVGEGTPHSRLSLPDETEAVIDFDRLVFKKTPKGSAKPAEIREIPLCDGDNLLPGGLLLHVHRDSTDPSQENQTTKKNIYTLFTQATLSSDKIVGKLYCRGRKSGDKIKKGGISRDVRQLMSEKKIPLDTRMIYPVICDEVGIVWIPDVATKDGCTAEKNESRITLTVYKTSEKDSQKRT